VPDVVIMAGPNGAGKSTSYPALQDMEREPWGLEPVKIPASHFVNADNIKRDEDVSERRAGVLTRERIAQLIQERKDFAFETTLSGRTERRIFEDLRNSGYRIYLAYIWVRQPELSFIRVTQRALSGGHFIPMDVVLRRWHRSIWNLFNIYADLSDFWLLADNSGPLPQVGAWGWGTKGSAFMADAQILDAARQAVKAAHELEGHASEVNLFEAAAPAEADEMTRMILEKIRQEVEKEIRERPKPDRIAVWQDGIRFIAS
jgi:predicted ABC-type ATPase